MNKLIEALLNIFNRYHFYKINNYLKKLKLVNFIDIGAHEGEFFKYFIKKNKFIKKSILIEPQENKILNLLKMTKKFNMKIIIKNIAIGNSNKQ